MDAFLSWHYTEGIGFYLRRWRATFSFINHYFSLPLLISSLFSTWKRVVDTSQVSGVNFGKYFEKMMFNAVSRMVGAVVRFILFSFGIFLLFLTATGGIFGLVIWLIVPFISYPFFSKYEKQPKRFAQKLVSRMHHKPHEQIKILFDNEAGHFVLTHLGINIDEVLQVAQAPTELVMGKYVEDYTQLLTFFTEAHFLPSQFLREKGLLESDFLAASQIWDKKRLELSEIESKDYFGRPGMGLELLFGYTPTLNAFSVDLGIPQTYSHHLIGRGDVVARIERSLAAGNSVVVVGAPGVGKKTVVLDFAYQAAKGWLGSQMAYRRVLELDYTALLANAGGIDGKKAKITEVLSEASYAGNVILVIRDLHKLTNAGVEGMDFTDIFERFMEKRELKIIAIATQGDFERFLAPNMRLRKFLDTVPVPQPSRTEAMSILMSVTQTQEERHHIIVTIPAVRAILEGSDRYITETPFPEKALELLDAVITYKTQKHEKEISPEDVHIILSERTGVSFARLTQSERKQLGNLEEIIHRRLVNQETAVTLIAKSLRSRAAGVKDENRPVGSFLFLGPTGVGKTQTAKVLASVYYGSESQILRFDMAEYSNREGVQRLIGSQDRNMPGVLTTSIKNKPASLLLLDEIEKAPPEVYNLLLTLLDEGYLTDAFGRKIDCRHLFVIATSNAAAEYIREQVASNLRGADLQKNVLEYIQTAKIFSPEFLNRFDGVVVFEPLTQARLVEVAKLQLEELAANLERKNIFLNVTPEVCAKIAADGYDPAFGARAMRRIIDLDLGDLIGAAILRDEVKSGDHIVIMPGLDKGRYYIQQDGS